MEGLEITLILKSKLLVDNENYRIDSDYFKKEFILSENILKNKCWEYLGNISKQIINFGAYSLCNQIEFLNKGVPFLNVGDIQPNKINYEDAKMINASLSEKVLWKSLAKENQVLLTIAGTIGKAAVAYKLPYLTNSNQAIANIETNKINPFFLSVYLNCSFGKDQTRKLTISSVQPNLLLTQVKKIKTYIPTENFQDKIEKMYKNSFYTFELSKKTYTQAETLLLETLALKDFKSSNEKINVKSFNDSFLSSGRLDAEYYQKKYEEITKSIKKSKAGYGKLSDFMDNYSTGYPYKSERYLENGLPLIRINNIQDGSLDLSNAANLPYEDANLSPKDIAVENDILISMSGTIGNTCKIPKGVKALINQRIMRITPKNYNVIALPLVLNSIIGKYQLERIGTGGVQTNISATDIKEILIPIIENSIQQQISEKIEESFRLKKQSEELLELAKTGVEMAIEEGEEKAMKFIEESLGKFEK